VKARCPRKTLSAPSIRQSAIDFWQEATGAIAIEYGLIAALIALAILGSIVQLGEAILGLPMQALIDAFIAALS
jgi:Flp pilus assembly pilin Flp